MHAGRHEWRNEIVDCVFPITPHTSVFRNKPDETSTHTPTTKKLASVLGDHATAPIFPSNTHLAASRPTSISHNRTTPPSSPVKTHAPSGLTLAHRTLAAAPSHRAASCVGNGRRLAGLGNEGMSELGSILSLVR